PPPAPHSPSLHDALPISNARVFPRASFRSIPFPNKHFRAVDPSVTTTFGRTAASWVIRYGRHDSTSSDRGPRFAGGRHFTTFVIDRKSTRLNSSHQISSY